MDSEMRLTFRQNTDAVCDSSQSEILTDQELFDKVKITDPNSELDSDDESPSLYTSYF